MLSDVMHCITTCGAPAGAGRLLVQSGTDGSWRVLTRPEQIDELRAALDPRGLRESGLFSALVRVQDDIKAAMPGQPLALPAETGEPQAR
jgi:hypothetical protein